MARRACGEVVVHVVYDRRTRIHPRVSGTYRARVAVGNSIIDSLCIGVPGVHQSRELYDDAIDEIAMTALEYSLGDHPDLPVVRNENGTLEIRAA